MLRYIKHIALLALFMGVVSLSAQEFGTNVVGTPVEEEAIVVKKQGFKPNVSVSLGTSFSSFGSGMNAFGTYVMPQITFPVSKKFAIRAGVGYSNTFFSTPGSEGSMFSQNNLQMGHVYVSGLYQVNENLIISGTAYKTFDIAQPQNVANPRALDYSNEGIAVNVDYKVSDRVSFSVGVSYQKYNPYNYYGNPGGFGGYPGGGFGGMQPSPFGNPGFGPGFGPGF